MLKSLHVSFLVTISSLSWLQAQVAAEAYIPKTFDEILLARKGCAEDRIDINMCMDLHKYRTRLTFTGEIRPITGKHLEFLNGMKKVWAAQPELLAVISAYHQEMLATSNGKRVWIFLQDPLVPEVKQYIKPGGDFLGYLVIPGALKTELQFMMTRFDEID